MIFDTRFTPAKKRSAAGISTLQTPSEEDLNVEGPPLVVVPHMSTSTLHLHRLNILTTSDTLHESRVSALTTPRHDLFHTFLSPSTPQGASSTSPLVDRSPCLWGSGRHICLRWPGRSGATAPCGAPGRGTLGEAGGGV